MNAADIKAGPLPDLDTLETIADWRVDLSTRLKRAQLRHELIGLHPEEIAVLGDETPTKEGVNILQQPCTDGYLLGSRSCHSRMTYHPLEHLTQALSCDRQHAASGTQ